MNDEPTIKVPPELDAAIDAVFAYGKPKAKRGRTSKAKTAKRKARSRNAAR